MNSSVLARARAAVKFAIVLVTLVLVAILGVAGCGSSSTSGGGCGSNEVSCGGDVCCPFSSPNYCPLTFACMTNAEAMVATNCSNTTFNGQPNSAAQFCSGAVGN